MDNAILVLRDDGGYDAFRFRMRPGDLVALPLKLTPAVAFGRLADDNRYVENAIDSVRHQRPVEWIREDVPAT